jgi:hypothetical protein
MKSRAAFRAKTGGTVVEPNEFTDRVKDYLKVGVIFLFRFF